MRSLVVYVLSILSLSCAVVSSPAPLSEIPGRYEYHSGGVDIQLNVAANHTYNEVIKYSDGAQEASSNSWEGDVPCLRFDALIVPPLDGTKASDVSTTPPTAARVHLKRTQRGTDQLDWCLFGERFFGKVRLNIFPDSDAFLRKKSKP